MPYFQDCKALCEYRQGHYTEAVKWAQKPLKIPGFMSWALLCCAGHGLLAAGGESKCASHVSQRDALEARYYPVTIAEDPGNAWLAWLFARIQLDEAPLPSSSRHQRPRTS